LCNIALLISFFAEGKRSIPISSTSHGLQWLNHGWLPILWVNHVRFQELKTWFHFQELKTRSALGINSWAGEGC
jgi:hypothetical protein